MFNDTSKIKILQILQPVVWSQVKGIPGVVGIGIGLKEKEMGRCNEIAWRIYVENKIPDALLNDNIRIPSSFFKIPTDVVQKSTTLACAYGGGTLDTLRPGILIRSDSGSEGTLGCFAQRKGQPNKIVMLSNSHVMYSNALELMGSSSGSLDIGQPKVSCSWCCKCKVVGSSKLAEAKKAFNEIRVNVTGHPLQVGSEIDCAIADFNRKRAYTNEIENVGMIKGPPPVGNLGVVAGSNVKKIGSSTGLTSGKIAQFNISGTIVGGGPVPNILFPLSVGGNQQELEMEGTLPNINQFFFIPDPDPDDPNKKMSFSTFGDSGSVVVNDSLQVVALLSRTAFIENDEIRDFFNQFMAPAFKIKPYVATVGVGMPIQKVLDTLDVEIIDNMQGPKVNSGVMISIPENGVPKQVDRDDWLSKKADTLEADINDSHVGHLLVRKVNQHRPEIFNMVNKCKPVMITWHRNKGPAFVAHCLRNLTEPAHKIPLEVEGVSRKQLISRMAEILKQNGSDELKIDFDTAFPYVMKYINEIDTATALPKLLQDMSEIINDEAMSGLLIN